MDVGPVIRDSGYYAVIEGRECYVSILGADYVKVPTPTGVVRHALSDVEKVIRVSTSATWRGARLAITTIGPEGAGFFTNDHFLGEAEGLHGDFYSGWDGVAPVSELTDVSERVSVIQGRTSPERSGAAAGACRRAALRLDGESSPFGEDPEHVDIIRFGTNPLMNRRSRPRSLGLSSGLGRPMTTVSWRTRRRYGW